MSCIAALNNEIKCLEYKVALHQASLGDMIANEGLYSVSQIDEKKKRINFIQLDIKELKGTLLTLKNHSNG